MATGDGGGATWPVPDRRHMMWPGMHSGEPGGPRRWLPVALWILCGAVLGAILTILLLVFAGPRPALLPPQTGVGSVTVTVDDAYLTAAMRQAAGGMPVVGGVTALTAHALPGDRIVLSGVSGALGASTPVSMTLQPFVRSGALAVRVLDARVGGLSLPAFLDAQIEAAINAQIATLGQSALSGSPHYVVTSVATTLGHITLTLGPTV